MPTMVLAARIRGKQAYSKGRPGAPPITFRTARRLGGRLHGLFSLAGLAQGIEAVVLFDLGEPVRAYAAGYRYGSTPIIA